MRRGRIPVFSSALMPRFALRTQRVSELLPAGRQIRCAATIAAATVFVCLIGPEPGQGQERAVPPPGRHAVRPAPSEPRTREILAPGSSRDLRIEQVAPGAAGWIDGTLTQNPGKWIELPPPVRARAVGFYDSTADRVVVFGGFVDAAPATDIWVLDLSGSLSWREVSIEGGPVLGENFVLAADPVRHRFYALNPLGQSGALVDLWALDVHDPPQWTHAPPVVGPAPVFGWGLSSTFDTQRQRIVVFGNLSPAVWALDVTGIPTWEQLVAGSATGPALVDQTPAFDPIGDRVLTYGGAAQTAPHILTDTDQVWTLAFADSVSWSRVAASGDTIGVRYGVQLVFDPADGNALLLGGDDASTRRDTASVFRLSLSPTPLCARTSPAGAMSRRRYSDVAVYDSRRDRFLLFGGEPSPDNSVDVDQFTPRPSPAWMSLEGIPLPLGRFGQAMAIDPLGDRALIFGGVSPAGWMSDTWVAPLQDPAHWVPVVAQDSTPSPRDEPVAIYDSARNRLVVFGGWTYPTNYFNDTWTLSFDGPPVWTRALPTGTLPPGRRADAAVYDPLRDRMLVFGGSSRLGTLSDVWALDLAGSMSWSELHPTGSGPPKRLFGSVVYDPTRDRVVLFGGEDTTYRSLSDSWALSLSDLRWEPLTIDSPGPSLTRHTAVYDLNGDRMIVFGGWDAVDPDFLIEFEDATFSLDLAPAPHWSWWTSPSGFEPVRSGHTAAFDPARGRMVTFGGGAIFGDGLNDTWLLELGSQPIRQAWLLGSQSQASSLALTWFLAQGPGATAVAERSSIGEGWHSVGTVTADNSSRALLQDTGLQSGWRYSYRLRSLTPGAPPMSADIVVTTAGSPSLRWLGAWPNPTSRSNLALQFVVGSVQPVDFELYDVVGRRAVSEKITPRSPGLLTIRPASSLGPGIYFARLTQDGHSVGGKVCVLQ